MTEEQKAYWLSILNGRLDIHPELVEFHMSRIHMYCLDTFDGKPTELNGHTYFLFCGRGKGHKGTHEDLDGGIFWSSISDEEVKALATLKQAGYILTDKKTWILPIGHMPTPTEYEALYLLKNKWGYGDVETNIVSL